MTIIKERLLPLVSQSRVLKNVLAEHIVGSIYVRRRNKRSIGMHRATCCTKRSYGTNKKYTFFGYPPIVPMEQHHLLPYTCGVPGNGLLTDFTSRCCCWRPRQRLIKSANAFESAIDAANAECFIELHQPNGCGIEAEILFLLLLFSKKRLERIARTEADKKYNSRQPQKLLHFYRPFFPH